MRQQQPGQLLPSGPVHHEQPVRSPELGTGNDDNGSITGRVVVMGDQIIVPVEGGVQILDPGRPSVSSTIELDATGNIAAMDGQIVVIDQMHASSFLSWDTASTLLERRIEEDPGAVITLTELAFRADRDDDILPSVERAMREVRARPVDQREQLRSRSSR